MTHFGFHDNRLSVLRWLKGISSTSTSNQRYCTNGKVLVFKESANTKIALYTYLSLTLNENYVGWAKIRVLKEYQLLAVTAKAVKVGAGLITRLKSLE